MQEIEMRNMKYVWWDLKILGNSLYSRFNRGCA